MKDMEVKKTNSGFLIDGKEFNKEDVIAEGIRKIHRNPNTGQRRQPVGTIDPVQNEKSESWLKKYLTKLSIKI